MNSPIVTVHGLKKRFGSNEILHGLDFEIPSGRIYGLIGHNGAGKTTTLNAMLGLTSYEGSVQVLGEDPYRHRARLMKHVAFISDVASLPRFLKGTEVRMHALIRALSKGMLAQLHLAVVMAIDARLLVLDEPTLGLDILYRKQFYQRLLEDYFDEQKTIIVTTHQVEEIEHILTDVMFIRDGRIVLDAPMEDIGQRYVEVLVNADRLADARALKPVDERALPFGKTVMLFDGVSQSQLEMLGETRTPGLADLFVATMKGTYA